MFRAFLPSLIRHSPLLKSFQAYQTAIPLTVNRTRKIKCYHGEEIKRTVLLELKKLLRLSLTFTQWKENSKKRPHEWRLKFFQVHRRRKAPAVVTGSHESAEVIFDRPFRPERSENKVFVCSTSFPAAAHWENFSISVYFCYENFFLY